MRPLDWRVSEIDEARVAGLAVEIGIRRLTARILVGRGMGEAAVAARFLSPRLADLRPPQGIADLERALARLEVAVTQHQRIAVFGDYDVDGVTTAAVLTVALRALGGEVIPRVARRQAGYGLGVDDVTRFADEGCQVLVTGDCGTSDHEALVLARQRGVDAVVIDHHQVPSGQSPAYALINPHRSDDRFPFKGLASCGLAFYMAAALRSRLRDVAGAFDPRELLDLVAMGTIADLVPLVDENRILVAAGLRVLTGRRRPGVEALCEIARLTEGSVSAEDVSFRMCPRINAAGRLGDAQLALDLLLAPDKETAARLAQDLDDRNRERQRIQETVWQQALEAAQEWETAAALVVGAEGWHQGVVGIIAAKLVDKFARPVVVVGFEKGEGRGSARTTPGFNLYEALAVCSQHLSRFGGHAGAAGMSLPLANLDGFRRAFTAEAERRLAGGPAPVVSVDAVLELADMDPALAEELGRLAPYGAANAEPLLVFPGVTTRSTRKVGQNHLQLTLGAGPSRAPVSIDAIGFGMAERDPGNGASLDVVASAELDTFRGQRRTRLRVRHLYPGRPAS
jgi:single-stranded-DNA-specific exonuclease